MLSFKHYERNRSVFSPTFLLLSLHFFLSSSPRLVCLMYLQLVWEFWTFCLHQVLGLEACNTLMVKTYFIFFRNLMWEIFWSLKMVFLFVCVYECFPAYMQVLQAQCVRRSEEGPESPRTGVPDGCELPCHGCWKLIPVFWKTNQCS